MSKDDHGALPPDEEAVVDSLLRADRIFDRFREQKGDGEFDPPGLTDRLLVAQIVNQTMMARAMGVAAGHGGPTPEDIFGKLHELRTRLFEELKAYVEELVGGRPPFGSVAVGADMPPVPPPSPEELEAINRELEAQGAPDWATIKHLSPREADEELLRFRVRRDMDAAVRDVRVVPPAVHADFEDVLFQKQVDAKAAKRTLELLVSTPQGHAMLKLMVYDAVQIEQRMRAAGAKPPQG